MDIHLTCEYATGVGHIESIDGGFRVSYYAGRGRVRQCERATLQAARYVLRRMAQSPETLGVRRIVRMNAVRCVSAIVADGLLPRPRWAKKPTADEVLAWDRYDHAEGLIRAILDDSTSVAEFEEVLADAAKVFDRDSLHPVDMWLAVLDGRFLVGAEQ